MHVAMSLAIRIKISVSGDRITRKMDANRGCGGAPCDQLGDVGADGTGPGDPRCSPASKPPDLALPRTRPRGRFLVMRDRSLWPVR